jgi:class 3 adenylate cyclase
MDKIERSSLAKLRFRLLSAPLRLKISIPFLIVATLLALLATFQVSISFSSTMERRLRGQLEDGAARVAEGVTEVESRQLTQLRALRFTQGVAAAVVALDRQALDSLAFPQIVNDQVWFADILDLNGQLVQNWHLTANGSYVSSDQTDYSSWAIVQAVSTGETDEQGDKFIAVQETPWGLALYTAGPIHDESGNRIGVALVGLPLQAFVNELQTLSVADVSLYNPAGQLTTSTLSVDLTGFGSQELAAVIADPDELPLYEVAADQRTYFEAVAPLYLRESNSGWFVAVSLPESLLTDFSGTNIWQLVLIFGLGVVALIGIGLLVAYLIARPIYGLLEATQRVSRGEFDQQVPVFANDEIGQLTRGFNSMVANLKEREWVNEIFGKMVSQDVREAVLNGQVSLGGESRPVTVLFTDMRGFTTMAEKVSPEEVIAVLNEFFSVISAATSKQGGLINRFGGDSALVVFGAPIQRPLFDSVKSAVQAAIDIRLGLAELNASRISQGLFPLRFGIGINSGTVVAGNLGSEDRFEYTVIGDPVNTAARLQGVAKQFPKTPLLVTAASVDPVKKQLGVNLKNLGDFSLRGREQEVKIYAILESFEAIPEGSQLFDPDQRLHAFIACYLYAKGHTIPTIAETLQVWEQDVNNWFSEAISAPESVVRILSTGFGLDQNEATRLWNLPENLKINSPLREGMNEHEHA